LLLFVLIITALLNLIEEPNLHLSLRFAFFASLVSSPKANKGDTRTESRAPKAQVQGYAPSVQATHRISLLRQRRREIRRRKACTFGAHEGAEKR